jgi:hypothetical protein
MIRLIGAYVIPRLLFLSMIAVAFNAYVTNSCTSSNALGGIFGQWQSSVDKIKKALDHTRW